MKKSGNKLKILLKIGLLSLLIFPFLILGVSYGVNDLVRQLFDPAIQNDNIIDMGENVSSVGENVFEGSIDIDLLDIDTDLRFAIDEVMVDDNGNPVCGWGNNKGNGTCPEECQIVSENNRDICKTEWRYKFMDASYLEASGGISRSPSIIVKVTRILLSLVITLSVTMILWNGMSYIIQTGQGKEGKNLVKNIIYIVVGILIALFSVVIITIIQSVPTTIENEVRMEVNNETDNSAVQNEEPIAGWTDGVNQSGHYHSRF